ncbi:MAG: histidine phosphatase superfamily, partial [Olpidium bornovanus]
MLKRSVETVEEFDPMVYDVKHIRFLNELYAGNMENLTKEEIMQRYPNEYKARQGNKLYYRYPGSGGESYLDMVARLNLIIVEIERMKNSVLIVAHTVVMRTILAYMLDIALQDMTRIPIPLHTLFCIKPNPHGAELKVYSYNEKDDRFYLIETPANFLRPSPAMPSPINLS